MTRFFLTAAVAALAMPSLAVAQDAPAAAAPAAVPAPAKLAQGATVYDAQGAVVGTIESLDGDYATLATANSKAKLPLVAFGTGAKGPIIGMTAAQVDAAAGTAGAAAAKPAATADAATPAKLAKGAAVSDTKGAPVGTIEEVGPEFAVVATARNKARLPLKAFAQTENGVVIGMSAAELDAAADAAKPKGATR